MSIMKKIYFKQVFIATMAVLLTTVSMEMQMNKVSAASRVQGEQLDEDEVMVKGGGSSYYVLNKGYSIYYAEDFMNVVYHRVDNKVNIWDVKQNLEYDLDTIRKNSIVKPDGFHLMRNKERDDLVNAAKKKNVSLQQYLTDCGIDLSYAPKHMTTANGAPNCVWNYSDVMRISSFEPARELFFEKYDISTNHKDNTKIGFIRCRDEYHNHFSEVIGSSRNWRFLFHYEDHLQEFLDINYLMLYVKN